MIEVGKISWKLLEVGKKALTVISSIKEDQKTALKRKMKFTRFIVYLV